MATHKPLSIVEIFGPTLAAKQELSSSTDWIVVSDHFNPADLDQLLDQCGCQNTKIFQEFFWLPVSSRRETVFAPTWLNEFCNFGYGLPILIDDMVTVDCFNFMIYKTRPIRQQIVFELQKRSLTTNSYIYAGSDSVGNIVPKYFGPARQSVYNNVADYNNFLRDNVFSRSAVSLIIETIEPEWHDNMTFTEKTLWAMVSLNFPIWLGGKNQAELWKNLGFDTFDDIVDHSYQYLPDPMERIHQALDSNHRLLTDLPYVSDLRQQMVERLTKNRQLVLDGAVKRFTNRLTANFDSDLLKKI